MVQYILFALFLGSISAVAAFDSECKKKWLKPVIAGTISFLVLGILNFWA
jgi:hypothetical protein